LCLVLAITPLRTVFGVAALARMRRMAGLFVYFYVLVHLVAYSWFDMGFELADIAKDIAKRPFILVGFAAFVLLTPLALTSFDRAIKALGGKRWQALHRLVYAVAGLAVLHFFWMRAGKNNFAEVAVYALILGVLLGWRVQRRWQQRSDRPYFAAGATTGAGK
jgi:sulfoxide reductase heme-binding subunit YedZ